MKVFRVTLGRRSDHSMSVIPQSRPVSYAPKRRPTWQRTLRAAWQDTQALWSEFHRPILTFVFVTLMGGYVYGELHAYAMQRGADFVNEIPLIDRPYTMLQLMILETPAVYSETPDEWYLVIFWYLLPPIFVFIVGDGAVEFVRLFFDRTRRLDAWREAVASTYRNHVIVLGAGHVGLRVIQILRDELDVDVVAIDMEPPEGVDEFLAARRVPLLRGNGTKDTILEKAGLKDADAFIACTGDDHTNLDAIMRARGMNRNIRIVARVWDDQFAQQIKDFMNVQSVLSSSEISAPVFAGLALGVELTQSISIGNVRYSTLRLTVADGSFIDGQTVGSLQESEDVDVVLHCAKGHPAEVQPAREALLKDGDILVIFGNEERCLQVATRNHFKR